ncbi:uncharacterized protein SAPINGB_P005082 [Magnusiomyces paraingens]|uniref:NAD(P)-binding protein n=1 Tax=Magnusiomyces paraingens TaxID=2606893 RepID=A0A5E8BYF5_9ASCO|nr:uncharacterized protein SAPINGB_P005082 [Saprochaete ingens]VVT56473.1 unnamed protein product [Saprochaete ingens]
MTLGTSPKDFNPNSLPFNDPEQIRKVAIVTGGNSGIGYYTVLHLFTHGWDVYLAARNPNKAAEAISKIKVEAESRKGELPARAVFGKIYFVQLDLSSLEKTKKGIAEFLSKESQLDLLVNNAGTLVLPIELNEDNLDVQIQTNHVGPVYLTISLLPLLLKSKCGPRVVFVSSLGHYFTDGPKDLGRVYKYAPGILSAWLRYSNSKLANIHATRALEKRYPSILWLAVHPGICTQTNINTFWTGLPIVGPIIGFFFNSLQNVVGISNEEGAYNSLFASLSPDLTFEENGAYFNPVGFETQTSKIASDPERIQYTWDWTIENIVNSGYLSLEEANKLGVSM